MSGFDWKYVLWLTWGVMILSGGRILSPLLADNWKIFQELLATRQQVQNPGLIRSEIEALEADNKRLESQIDTTLRNVPSADALSRLYEALNNSAAKYQVQLTSVTPKPIREKGDFREMEIHASFYADFHALVKFIYEIEHEQGMLCVGKIEIDPARSAKVKGKVWFSVYLR